MIKDYGNSKISEKICALKNNMCVHIDGAFGINYYDKENDKIVFNNKPIEHKNILMFYCGTGITPFYSILKNVKKDTQYNFKLFGSLKNKTDNVLTNIGVKHRIFYFDNKINEKKLNKILKNYDVTETTILLCGSESYNNFITNSINKAFTICKW
jgi:ferredoxin-NADP reductase